MRKPHVRRLVLRDAPDPRRSDPGRRHQRPGPADLPDDLVHVQRCDPRGEPVRAQGVRQHLHPHHEPDPGGRGGARGLAGGRRGCAAGQLRPGRGDAGHPQRGRGRGSRRVLPSLYGGTYNLFHYTLPKLGIEVTFVEDPDDLDSWRAAVRPNTKAFFGESISNPKNDVLDIAGVAGVAHEAGVPLIVDNTVATPTSSGPSSGARTSSSTRPPSTWAATARQSRA